jgi:NADH:ubiquinone oxidoreductase subunit K
VSLPFLLAVAAAVAALGCFGVLARRRLSSTVVGAQLMVVGAVVALLAVSHAWPSSHPPRGEAFAVLLAGVGVAQGAVGLVVAQLGGAQPADREEDLAAH